jgi:redox-sensitive bicupin YhaK (pirin superfamily)
MIGEVIAAIIVRMIAGSRRRTIAGKVSNTRMIAMIRTRVITIKMFAGRHRSQIVRQIAGEVKMSGMFAIEVRLAIIRMIARDLITRRMRSRSAEVLLFLNSGLTTPWARGHRG